MGYPVDGRVIQRVELYRWRSVPSRLDVWPFAILYLSWMIAVAPRLDFMDSTVLLGVLGLSHILVLLFSAWSVNFRCFVQASKASDVHQAEVCKVIPEKFSGSKEVVPLQHRKVLVGEKEVFARESSQGLTVKQLAASAPSAVPVREEISFDFRKQRFIFNAENENFCKLRYPLKEKFGSYSKTTGYGSEAKAQAAMEKWGRNIFEFPQPTFQKLMKEHCMEPFFVFQVFCVGLWCLDEYWYYSLFTLFMLILFESTVVKSRLRTLTELRRVRVDSQTLMVHRGGKWIRLSGMDLLPGDVVSIGRAAGQGSDERTIPADMLLLAGSAITNEAILTGESMPQWKVPITGRDSAESLSLKLDKNHVLFGGTKILQHTSDKSAHLKTPDGGCLGVVLRTGFETSQGKLMRTILFSTERVTANNWESGLFICFLVIFALIAAGYVLKKGLEDPSRSKYKLFLNCSLIITSVIPPELPMELSIAVNTSLIALARRGVYCTEPFRIPFAGKVDVCCFDKTGTLTSDDMEFRGVGLDGDIELETDSCKLPEQTVQVLAACHALVFVDNKLVGDPLEKAALKGIDWAYTSDERAVPRKGNFHPVQILQRHFFASHLKRMSTVVRIDEMFFAFVKGAPEVIHERLLEVQPGYTESYKHYTRQGSRVLALAYKQIPDMPVSEARNLDRDVVESGLSFAGFAVFACPLRTDSADVLKELRNSSHDLVMITGDQALTACHVASQVGIVASSVLILTPNEGAFEWTSPNETVQITYREEHVAELSGMHDLCIAGDSLAMLQRTGGMQSVIPFIKVFARVAPDQKELILIALKAAGRVALMCGDGTNDVGALKQAHVGVALLNAAPPAAPVAESISSQATTTVNGKATKVKRSKSGVIGSTGVPSITSTNDSSSSRPGVVNRSVKVGSTAVELKLSDNGLSAAPSNRTLTPAERQKQKLKRLMDEIGEEGDGRTPPVVRLGDASMASAFTAKHASVRPTTDIIRQGRSTLVTTLQMFKILGLNCLATAYVLSVMYLDGVKLGDVQATISGLFTAAFFLFISHARPLDTLSAERPHPNIFCAYVFLSLLGQFAIHITFLISVTMAAGKYMPEECIEPDSDFQPNLVNTVSYMANMMIQVATFAVNYMGHPFNQSIRENKPFLYALALAAVFFTAVTSDMFRSLNDWMKLVPLPQPFGLQLLFWASLMIISCYVWEHMLRWMFPGRILSVGHSQRHSKVKAAPRAKED
eukprot:c29252_g1_i1 orf=394-4089(+)